MRNKSVWQRACGLARTVVEAGEASRGLRIHDKEPEHKTNAEPELAFAA